MSSQRKSHEGTDESSRVVAYAYDGLNRQTNMTVDPGGGHLNLTTTTAYDPTPGVIGQTSTVTNPAGQVITTAVAGIGRTAAITGNTATVQYTYDVVIVGGPNNGLVQTTMATDPTGKNLTDEQRGRGAPAQAGGESRMKEPHEVRPSQSPRPQVMRRVG